MCTSPGIVSENWKQKIIDLGSKQWSEYTLRADYPKKVTLTDITLIEKLENAGFRISFLENLEWEMGSQ